MKNVTKKQITEETRTKQVHTNAFQKVYTHNYDHKINGVSYNFETSASNPAIYVTIKTDDSLSHDCLVNWLDVVTKKTFVDVVYEYLNKI